jgi:CubicO group peptidase (beta-lactamase class C family)
MPLPGKNKLLSIEAEGESGMIVSHLTAIGIRSLGLLLLGIATGPGAAVGVAQQDVLASSAERSLIDKQVGPLPTGVQVAVALVNDGAARFLGAERTPEGIRYLDNRAAVFEIGSITKIYTAMLLAQQVQKGALRLDEPVRGLVPFELNSSARGGVELTLKHLASHTSGMCHQPPWLNFHAYIHFHPSEPFSDYDRARFEYYLKWQMGLDFTPGEKYQYSNMGMSLVGYILALRTGKSYEALLQENIFGPLSMKSSTTEISSVRDRVVPGIEDEGVAAPNWDMNALAPAGGILTSAEDFARFARAQFEPDPAIAMTQQPTFKIEENYFVGLGWHIIVRVNGERWLNHGGGMAGYTAIVNVNVRKKRAVIVLSNLGNAHKLAENVSQLGRDLLANLETERSTSPAPGCP